MISSAACTVAVMGSINIDVVLRVARFPAAGETILSSDVVRHPGGKGANQAIAAARAGATVRMIGAVGSDADGQEMRRLLEADGIDCADVVVTRDHATGAAFVLVDGAGENQIIASPGANQATRCRAGASDTVLLAQLEVPLENVGSFLSTRRPGAIAILNAAPYHRNASSLLPLADIVVVNEIELAAYGNDTMPPTSVACAVEMALAIIDRQDQTIIVTRGKDGSVAVGADGVLVTSAKVTQVVDTTGAGDCFCGFLAAGLAVGRTHGDAIRQAHAAAAVAVGRWGAASSIPFLSELD